MGIAQPRVDHVVLDTRDRLEEAVRVYRSLGFQLTDRGRHTLGSINHLAVFESDYLELLGFDIAAAAVRADIAQYPVGLNGLVFATPSADCLFHDLKARGVPVQEPVAFSRPVILPDGSHDAKFRVVRLQQDAVSFGRLYFCQHLTPDLVWRPEWRKHPNGAVGIARVSIAVRDPGVSADLFIRMFGREIMRQASAGSLTLAAGTVEIELVATDTLQVQLGDAMPLPSGRSDFIAKLGIRTASLRATSKALRDGGIPFTHPDPGRILIPASAALNVAIEFAEWRT